MIDENPIRTARRQSRRLEQGRCLLCGRKDLAMEEHHVAGQNHDSKFTAPLCQACHSLATENLRRGGVDMRRDRSDIRRIGWALKATGVFLQMLTSALFRWADSLFEEDRK